ncbi:MAG: glycosyltransferase family 4 protein [Candidatus Thermoplasmatota archaeon]|jgi:glycosyltransferase involved in cell wall biosynthesis|nr:glycosyltransferase family 4 protein [Candidatus Thermoplasmatota archaeon]
MKLAFLIQGIHPNAGQTHSISEVISYLSSVHSDWQIDVLTPKINYPLVDGLNAKNVTVTRIDQLYSCVIFSGRLAKRLSEYDLVYVKGSLPYVFPAVKSGKPSILVVHQLDSPRLFRSVSKKLRIMAATLLTYYVLKRPDVVVTVTQELADFYAHQYGLRMTVIEDQIPNSFYEIKERNPPTSDGKLRLLSVGPWDGYNGRKRHDILLEYFSTAVNYNSSLRLTLVGLSDENIKELGNLSKKYGISEFVTLKGYMTELNLINEYARNHVYVTATSYEGFYRQIIEAFATGMPALVYDAAKIVRDRSQSAATNHVLKSNAGKLYDSSTSFAQSLKTILRNYKEFSDKARQYSLSYRSNVVGTKTERMMLTLLHKDE